MSDILKVLKENGLKITNSRLKIFGILQKSECTLPALEIYKKLKKSLDLVTVYRTLQIFLEKKIIFSEFVDGETRYYFSESQHHHITCTQCQKVECVPCEHTFNIKNFKNIEHSFIMVGLCKTCDLLMH